MGGGERRKKEGRRGGEEEEEEFETKSHCVALFDLECYIDQASLELIEFNLPLPSECWY
jgi:hypothetical protein